MKPRREWVICFRCCRMLVDGTNQRTKRDCIDAFIRKRDYVTWASALQDGYRCVPITWDVPER